MSTWITCSDVEQGYLFTVVYSVMAMWPSQKCVYIHRVGVKRGSGSIVSGIYTIITFMEDYV